MAVKGIAIAPPRPCLYLIRILVCTTAGVTVAGFSLMQYMKLKMPLSLLLASY